MKASPRVMRALQGRMVTLDIPEDRPLGVLDFVPRAHASAKEAIEALDDAVTRAYGAAARALVARLAEEANADEPKLRKRIAKLIRRFLRAVGADGLKGHEARAAKLFALVYAAGRLARESGIMPKSWGRPKELVRRVYEHWWASAGIAPATPAAVERLKAFLDTSKGGWVRASSVKEPLGRKAFRATPGFLVRRASGERVLLVPAETLRAVFGLDNREALRELHDGGIVEVGQGASGKLTDKAPRALSRSRERVYRIPLDELPKAVG